MGKLSLRFRVSVFGFRVSGFGFRVSIGYGEVKSSVSGFGFRVSGFGFRSVMGKLSLQSRFRVSGFGFRWSKPTLQISLRITSPASCTSLVDIGGFKFKNCLPALLKDSYMIPAYTC